MAEEEVKKNTEIKNIGEFGLIKRLTEKIELVQPSSLKGVGDDAAVIAPPAHDEVLLLSTDMLAEGIHFELTYTPLRHLGYKSVAVNVSDICAMNGVPAQVVISIAVSNHYSVESLDEIYRGIRYACREYKVDLVGGDTISSLSGLVINISIVGKTKKENVVYRSGAKAGDLLCVSGDLGAAYAGLVLLEKARKTIGSDPSQKPEFEGLGYVLQRQLMPHARVDMVELFRESGVKPTAMIDISDGLASEIHHICEESKVGCLLEEAKIPIHEETIKVAQENGISPSIFAFSGGEDYELLFTINPSDYKKIKDPGMLTIIGEILPAGDGIMLAAKDGKMHPLAVQGWDALKGK
ncbi:MAG: thiamine-phosphate kinase [Bacteroidia bacterium]